MNKLSKKELKNLESIFTRIQRKVENGINELYDLPPIRVAKVWKRDEGGGGKSISITGDTIEKAAVNYSSISEYFEILNDDYSEIFSTKNYKVYSR